MDAAELAKAMELAKAAALKSGAALKEKFGSSEFEVKPDDDSPANVVTQLDFDTEKLLKEELQGFSSDIGFKGEEFGSVGDPDNKWLVDPIDGTAHFVRGIPFCTTMIALIIDGQVVGSVISDFVRGDLYHASLGGGAYKNDQPIKVSSRSLNESYLVVEMNLTHVENQKILAQLQDICIPLELANCGYDFAMIAQGKLDGRIMKNPFGQDWDVAPGSLLVSEAGGEVANLGSADYDYNNLEFIAANPQVMADLTNGPDALFPREN